MPKILNQFWIRPGAALSSVVLLMGLLLSPHSPFRATDVLAQSPKEFYTHDYAVAPGVGDNGEIPAREGSSLSSEIKPELLDNPDIHGGIKRSNRAVNDNGNNSGSDVSGSKRRKLLIHLVVNSRDKSHLDKVIEVALRLHDERLAFVGSINHIGDYRNISDEVKSGLSRRGITLVAGPSLAVTPELSLSPAWDIYTQGGRHLVEGIIRVDSLINSFGEFEPQQSIATPVEQRIEGF